MTHQEIIEAVAALLDQHHRGIRGALRQIEYRSDFFRLFAESYWQAKRNPSGPSITGDGLCEEIAEHWLLDDSEDSQRKRELLQRLCSMWDECSLPGITMTTHRPSQAMQPTAGRSDASPS